MVGECGKMGEGGQKKEMLEELRKQCQVVFQEQYQKFMEEMLQQWKEQFLGAFAEQYLHVLEVQYQRVFEQQYQEIVEENAILREELARVNGTWKRAAEQGMNYREMEERLSEDFGVQKGKQAKEIEVQNVRADNLESKVGSRKGANDVDRVRMGNRFGLSEKGLNRKRRD